MILEELRPETIMGLRLAGVSMLRDVQSSSIRISAQATDLLIQGRAGTGKSTTIGLLVSEEAQQGKVSIVCVANETLRNEMLINLRRMFQCSSISFESCERSNRGAASTPAGKAFHRVFVGTPGQLMIMDELSISSLVLHFFFDEADELFNGSLFLLSTAVLSRFMSQETRTRFFSATFPPFIVSRIEEALLAADPSRSCRPHHLKLCSSTCVERDLNPVVPHLEYFYQSFGSQEESVRGVVETILTSVRPGEKSIVFDIPSRIIKTLNEHITEAGHSVAVVKSHGTPESYLSADVILDPHALLSRGVNIPSLVLGFSLSIPQDKETLLHQWGRIGREGLRGAFHMMVHKEDLDQLQYLSFQLGVDFHEFFPPNRHPFEVQSSTEERMQAVRKLASQFNF